MSYEPTTWKAGDTVTSAKLNKMEQGIAGSNTGNFIITYNSQADSCDKTWQEVADAISNGQTVYLKDLENENNGIFELQSLTSIKSRDDEYFEVNFQSYRMMSRSKDDYLTLDA